MDNFFTDDDVMKRVCSGCGWGDIDQDDITDVVIVMIEEGSGCDEVRSTPQRVERVKVSYFLQFTTYFKCRICHF